MSTYIIARKEGQWQGPGSSRVLQSGIPRLFKEFFGRHADVFFKHLYEVFVIRKADHISDFIDLIIGFLHFFHGLLNTVAVEVIVKGIMHFFLELCLEVHAGYPQGPHRHPAGGFFVNTATL